MLSNWFKKSHTQNAPPLSSYSDVAVDFHSHLIPGIDDGVKTAEESIAALKEYQRLGFRKVITTPHVMVDGYRNSSSTIIEGRDKVRSVLKENNISIDFEAAAEYYLDEGIYEKIENRDLLMMGDNFVLVEVSYIYKSSMFFDIVFKMQTAGYKVILAHPERYPYYYTENLSVYRELKERNIYFQINLMSLIGKYGKQAKASAEELIDANLVEFVGSDLHGVRHIQSIEQCLSNAHLINLVQSGRLLNHLL